MATRRKTISIIGCGNVGQTLGRLWANDDSVVLQDVMNRSAESAASSVAFIGAGRAVAAFADLRAADIFVVACPDDRIASCCNALADSGILRPDNVVFHCSGALPSTTLLAAANQRALIASVHPIRSFAVPEQLVHHFSGTFCGVEGDPKAIVRLGQVFSAIGATLVPIDPASKTIYHAAAVFASNYLVTLLDTACEAYVKSGIRPDTALKLMEPLVRETVNNVFRLGSTHALTGPIARRDLRTVVRQYRAVNQWNRRRGALYKLLGKLTAAIATRRK
jgi:predicted short-subunit dehydrogenase-like oxidoreductase (DUF2520 family)